MKYGKYQDGGGWFEAVVLPHPQTDRLYKYRGTTANGDVIFWSQFPDAEQAKADFESHYESVTLNGKFEKEAVPFAELPVDHYFTFILPGHAGINAYIKKAEGVKPLAVQPPPFDDSTLVEDNGPC